MIALFVVMAVLVWGFIFVGFFIWVFTQASQAAKYREMVASLPSNNEEPLGWKISYKMNGVVRSVIINVPTEEEALKVYLAKGLPPLGVTSVEKT